MFGLFSTKIACPHLLSLDLWYSQISNIPTALSSCFWKLCEGWPDLTCCLFAEIKTARKEGTDEFVDIPRAGALGQTVCLNFAVPLLLGLAGYDLCA